MAQVQLHTSGQVRAPDLFSSIFVERLVFWILRVPAVNNFVIGERLWGFNFDLGSIGTLLFPHAYFNAFEQNVGMGAPKTGFLLILFRVVFMLSANVFEIIDAAYNHVPPSGGMIVGEKVVKRVEKQCQVSLGKVGAFGKGR
jgi:hypothetical protein